MCNKDYEAEEEARAQQKGCGAINGRMNDKKRTLSVTVKIRLTSFHNIRV
jgi:hypothetical protein